MISPRNVLHVFAATLVLGVAACQPAPLPVEMSAKSLDRSAKPVGEWVDRVAQTAREAGASATSK